MINQYRLQGLNLIEAGAGTGKTYTISRLYLRLLLEKQLSVKQILVVTFTVAATLELRDRIRELISQAQYLVSGGQPLPDGIPTPPNAVQLLKNAVSEFDEAAIFTIHSFCDRILRENCFESRVLFNTELLEDVSRINRQIVEDYLRMHNLKDTAALWEIVKLQQRAPLAPLAPAMVQAATDYDRLGAALISCLTDLYDNPRVSLGDIPQRYPHPSWPEHAAILDEVTTKSKEFTALYKQYRQAQLSQLALNFRDFYRERLANLRHSLNFRSFNDILLDLYTTINSGSGDLLVQSIHRRYAAAMIDECQDTDKLQFEIFRRFFMDDSDMPCFLIGDPKQSIYGFRNADIFSYLDISRHVGQRYTLGINYRSSDLNITAANSIFTSMQKPFLLPGLDYHPVAPSPESKGNQTPLSFSGSLRDEAESGIDFIHLDVPGRETKQGPKPPEDPDLQKASVAATTAKISQLLASNQVRIGDRELRPSDIAILVMQHDQARAILEALRALNIPAVVQNNGNVLICREADELLLVLNAILDPRRENFNGALLTRLCGIAPERLDSMLADEFDSSYEDHILRFKQYYEIWNQQGFFPMFRRFLDDYQTRSRLLREPGGERRLTNLLQLGEILNSADISGANTLFDWFCRQRASDEGTEYEMRLERDDDAVKIMTVFASKGLEFPLVFCPFFWSKGLRKQNRGNFGIYHEDNQALIGLKNDADSVEAMRFEDLAETMRLFYVGLTRARNKCWVYWNEAMTTNPFTLLFGENYEVPASLPGVRFLNGFDPAALPLPVTTGAIELNPLPVPPPESRLKSLWTITSFSSLAGSRHTLTVEDGMPEDDEGGSTTETVPEARGFMAFPRGANPGSFIHQVLEEMDFAITDPAGLENLIRRYLKLYNITSRNQSEDLLTAGVMEMLRKLMSASLSGDPRFKLGNLPPERRLVELEFHFTMTPAYGPLPEFPTWPLLNRFLRTNPVPTGFMNGFIDLIFQHGGKFYILDWKSNYLGPFPDDYRPEKLHRAIDEHLYNLQYLIYCVALDRFLRQRLPGYTYETHFGGVYYIFLRGVGERDNGIFFERPAPELIRTLAAHLEGNG